MTRALTLRSNHLWSLLLIVAAALLVYSNAFHAPFQLDEELYLRDNPFVSQPGVGLPKDPELRKTVIQRTVGYLTFALNYRLNGLRVEGFHVFNIAVHLLNAVLVYLLVMLTFKTPRLATSSIGARSGLISLFAGLLFAVHPLQTEAVTYIMQRLASLAAFFYLLSLVLYVRWRTSGEEQAGDRGAGVSFRRAHAGWFWWSFFSAILAMKTKENAVTLPVTIFLYELVFFRGPARERLRRLLPFGAALLIVPLTTLILVRGSSMAALTQSNETIPWTWWSYLLTQVRVLVTYFRLLVWPVGQTFMYDYPVLTSWSSPGVLPSLLLHAVLLGTGPVLLRMSARKDPALRIIAFGIFWFYITLFVESGLVPLPLACCEYRVYLPSVGFFIALLTGCFLLQATVPSRLPLRALVVLLSSLAVASGAAAYQRNGLLNDNIALWEDTVRKSPNKAKAHNNLGTFYARKDRLGEAEREFRTTLRLKPDADSTRHNLINVLLRQNKLDEAAAEQKKFEQNFPKDVDPVHVHTRLGDLYAQRGALRQAAGEYEAVLKLKPDDLEVRYDLANALAQNGDHAAAVREYREVLRRDPGHIGAHNNLAGVYAQLRRFKDAQKELNEVLRLDPNHEDARYNLQYVTDLLRSKNSHQE